MLSQKIYFPTSPHINLYRIVLKRYLYKRYTQGKRHKMANPSSGPFHTSFPKGPTTHQALPEIVVSKSLNFDYAEEIRKNLSTDLSDIQEVFNVKNITKITIDEAGRETHCNLKNECQIEHHFHRSRRNFLANLFGGRTGYQLQPSKPSLRLAPHYALIPNRRFYSYAQVRSPSDEASFLDGGCGVNFINRKVYRNKFAANKLPSKRSEDLQDKERMA